MHVPHCTHLILSLTIGILCACSEPATDGVGADSGAAIPSDITAPPEDHSPDATSTMDTTGDKDVSPAGDAESAPLDAQESTPLADIDPVEDVLSPDSTNDTQGTLLPPESDGELQDVTVDTAEPTDDTAEPADTSTEDVALETDTSVDADTTEPSDTTTAACSSEKIIFTQANPQQFEFYELCVSADGTDEATLQAIDASLYCGISGMFAGCDASKEVGCHGDLLYDAPGSKVISELGWERLCALSAIEDVRVIAGGHWL